jgi:Uma2 family endonuclease
VTVSRTPPDTVADFLRTLGDTPPERVLWTPQPGTATEEEAVRLNAGFPRRRVELVNGTLVEKPMGTRESYLAFTLIGHLFVYQRTHNLGVFGAPDALMRLAAGLVRLPDVHFTSWANLPADSAHLRPVVDYPPDLAVEILSESDRPGALAQKVREYFAAGTRVVWVIDQEERTARVYTTADESTTLTAADTLDGGEVLPGFALPLAELFDEPQLNPRPPQA